MSREPSDQAARDAIRTRLGDTLFVEAGAGTGKTTALVDRVVALVADGVRLRDIAAITFTEAAAAELRDRVRARLHQAASGHLVPPLPDEARARCTAALDELDEAALSTLHGFAQRILSDHALEAGLPPRFDVLDEIAAGVEFERRWRRFVDELYADDDARDVLLTALVLDVPFAKLRGVARALHEHHDRLRGAAFATAPLPRVDLRRVADPLREALALLPSCRDADDLLACHLERLAHVLTHVDSTADTLEQLETLRAIPKLTLGRGGRKGNWPDIELVRGALAGAEHARLTLLEGLQVAALTALVERIRTFLVRYADERWRGGSLEFHDLLVGTRDLLRNRPDVRSRLASRFAYLLVDEFQDTDPLQIEIAILLTSVAGDDGEAWTDLVPVPGRLFLVGDPKQSIYRFRRADLGVYHRAAELLGGDGTVRLVENFRSVPGVIAWVNHLFAELFGAGEPGVQAAQVHLVAHREPVVGPAAVHWFGERAEARVGAVRAREADDVAALVARMKVEGWTVVDSDGRERPAAYADMALLLPTRAALPALELALEGADIPVRIESQSLIFSTTEVRDLLSILEAIDDPTDKVALIAALRTAAFGCGDDELYAFHAAGGSWDYRRQPDEDLPADHPLASGPVVEGMWALRALHERRWWSSVADLAETVVRERRFLELALAHRRPRDHWRRVRYLVDQARAYEAAGGSGLRGFLDWIQILTDEHARAVEVVVPEADDDALRVLTVHGAKGLEFPIVLLAGLNAGPPTVPPTVVWSEAEQFEVGIGNQYQRVATAGYADAIGRTRLLDDAERLRLLYVASTRARDHLLVSLHHSDKAKTCHAYQLWDHVTTWPAEAIDPGPPVRPAPAPVSAEPAPADLLTERERWIEQRGDVLRRAARPASVAATSLADAGRAGDGGRERDPLLEKDEPAGDESAPWQRGRAGTSVGRAVHAVLQTIDLDTGEGLDETARAQALAEGVPTREREIASLARSVVDAPVVRAAVANRYWREVPVATIVDGTVVEGFVDLLVDGPDGLIVVDYKTDQVDEGELDRRMAKYRLQGATYALALEDVLGRPVRQCAFVFARAGGAFARVVDDVPAAIAEVRQRVVAMSR